MDRRLQETILRGDTQAFRSIIQEDEDIINQKLSGSSNTILHLTARYGHVELASEILKLRPELVAAENDSMETPLHEACREGRMEIVRVLMEIDPWVVYKVNKEGESVLFVSCERGRVDVVKHLLSYPFLLMLEVDALTPSLHVAAAGGHTDIFRLMLQARPDFATKKDMNGCTPLHLCCSKGHLDITRELLRLDHDLSCLQDNEGRTPLHWAAIKGRVAIIDEILSVSLQSAEFITKNGESVLHLAVKNNQYDAVKYLTETLNITKLINLPDNDGNTVLHIATAGKLSTMATYLLKMGIDVNAINRKGYTALDVVESDASNSGALLILPALQEAGAKRCDQLGPFSREIQQVYENINSPIEHYSPKLSDSHRPHHHRHHRRRRAKQLELQNEGLRNARKTITVVAVLIATVTFSAGINPPGGFSQETGRTMLGKQTPFKVFLLCNIVALFLSIGIVIFLVSIIPYKRKSMMKLLVVTHKAMWVALSFMAAAYIAALWAVLPQARRGTVWVLVAVVGIGGGCTLAIFVSLGMLLAKHWIRKWEWKRMKKEKQSKSPNSTISRVEELRMMKNGNNDYSSNSDVDSSDQGYHLY